MMSEEWAWATQHQQQQYDEKLKTVEIAENNNKNHLNDDDYTTSPNAHLTPLPEQRRSLSNSTQLRLGLCFSLSLSKSDGKSQKRRKILPSFLVVRARFAISRYPRFIHSFILKGFLSLFFMKWKFSLLSNNTQQSCREHHDVEDEKVRNGWNFSQLVFPWA